MKWISATDLKQWGGTRACQDTLPELIRRLVRASSVNIKKIKFPSGDSVHLGGWDGELICKEEVYLVKPKISLWEIGTNKNIIGKAEREYTKRSKNPLGYNKAESTFVFVTPREWDGAEKWTNEKNALKEWKEVIVLTAVELEDWLSLCPVVSLWLAEILHKSNYDFVYTVGSFWNKWSTGKEISLKSDVLLGGRTEEREKIINNMLKPSINIVQSMAQEESMAFVMACILNSEKKESFQSRCIIIKNNEDILNRLVDEYENLIIITNVEHKNHFYALEKGHSIFYATCPADMTSDKDSIILPPIDKGLFVKSLQRSGIDRDYADQLSRETVRNITILRRKLSIDYTVPEWAKPENIQDLVPAILVGRWNEKSVGDKEIISLVANETYELYEKKLNRWLNSDDSPLVNVDGLWRIISPYEAMLYAAKYISSTDYKKYEHAIELISEDTDPDAINKKESTGLRFWKYKQKYSPWLKEGVFQNAILISILSNDLRTPIIISYEWINNIIDDILKNSSIEWWLSNKSLMTYIA